MRGRRILPLVLKGVTLQVDVEVSPQNVCVPSFRNMENVKMGTPPYIGMPRNG
jgi:hypothetical protein